MNVSIMFFRRDMRGQLQSTLHTAQLKKIYLHCGSYMCMCLHITVGILKFHDTVTP
jgi:hypothetical protein